MCTPQREADAAYDRKEYAAGGNVRRKVCFVTGGGSRRPDYSHVFLPSRREEGSSLISIFFFFCFISTSPSLSEFWGFFVCLFGGFLFLRPEDLRRMPSNAVAAAFKGSDYTDAPGSRMVRQTWGGGQHLGSPFRRLLRFSYGE